MLVATIDEKKEKIVTNLVAIPLPDLSSILTFNKGQRDICATNIVHGLLSAKNNTLEFKYDVEGFSSNQSKRAVTRLINLDLVDLKLKNTDPNNYRQRSTFLTLDAEKLQGFISSHMDLKKWAFPLYEKCGMTNGYYKTIHKRLSRDLSFETTVRILQRIIYKGYRKSFNSIGHFLRWCVNVINRELNTSDYLKKIVSIPLRRVQIFWEKQKLKTQGIYSNVYKGTKNMFINKKEGSYEGIRAQENGLWQELKPHLVQRLGEKVYKAWFEEWEAKESETTIHLLAPSKIKKDWVSEQHGEKISGILAALRPPMPNCREKLISYEVINQNQQKERLEEQDYLSSTSPQKKENCASNTPYSQPTTIFSANIPTSPKKILSDEEMIRRIMGARRKSGKLININEWIDNLTQKDAEDVMWEASRIRQARTGKGILGYMPFSLKEIKGLMKLRYEESISKGRPLGFTGQEEIRKFLVGCLARLSWDRKLRNFLYICNGDFSKSPLIKEETNLVVI